MYRIVCLTYKSLNGMTPDYLTNLFKPLSTVSQRQTRKHGKHGSVGAKL